jgi:hypothetical protein
VIGNLVNSVARLAQEVNEFGVKLEVGDTFVADYDPLGQISIGDVE